MMVDWTSMSFMAFYIAFIFPALYVTDKCGLRWTITIGAGLNCLGAWIKTLSIQPDRFYVVIIGHSLVALAQVISFIIIHFINLYQKSRYYYNFCLSSFFMIGSLLCILYNLLIKE